MVVTGPGNGQVLAMASFPTYDPGIWTSGVSQREYDRLLDPARGQPLVSRLVADTFPPASTFKVVSLPAALRQEQAGGSFQLIFCDPPYRLADRIGEELNTGIAALLAPGGRAVIESPASRTVDLPSMTMIRERRYGGTTAGLAGGATLISLGLRRNFSDSLRISGAMVAEKNSV